MIVNKFFMIVNKFFLMIVNFLSKFKVGTIKILYYWEGF